MSDSEDSTVTYTEVSSLFEDLSDIGSPGVVVHGYDGLLVMPEDAYGYIEAEMQEPPVPNFFPEPVYPEFMPAEDDALPTEEQPLPAADSPTGDSSGYVPESDSEEDPEEDDEDPEEDPTEYPTDRDDNDEEEESSEDEADDEEEDEDEEEEEEEEHPAPADSISPPPVRHTTTRISIRAQTPPFLSRVEAERLLALPTLPPSLLTPYSLPLPQILAPPLPVSPQLLVSSPPLSLPSPLPTSPTYAEAPLGFRAARIRLREVLPSPVYETEIPEICLPLRKRLCHTALTPRYEVGESLVAAAARQVRPAVAREDPYRFVDMVDAATGGSRYRELDYVIIDTWDDLVGAIQEIAPTTLEGVNKRVVELSTTFEQETSIKYAQMEDARDDQALLTGRVNRLFKDRSFHHHTALLMAEEARVSRAAWE
ncbi:hypothetical protein Tco_0657716 [Tanacetum coccineum]